MQVQRFKQAREQQLENQRRAEEEAIAMRYIENAALRAHRANLMVEGWNNVAEHQESCLQMRGGFHITQAQMLDQTGVGATPINHFAVSSKSLS